MASDYGLNFGFRRSDESMAIREGRFKTPAGSALRLGTAVEIDPAAPGYLRQCAAGADLIPGVSGLLVQEESHIGSVFDVSPLLGHDSLDLGVGKADQLSVIWGGAGTKVWFQNTAAYSRGNRAKDAVTMFAAAGLAVGDSLGWNGTQWAEVAAGSADAWMTVTAVNTTTGYVEAVLTR